MRLISLHLKIVLIKKEKKLVTSIAYFSIKNARIIIVTLTMDWLS